jgi:hypothetical protein
MTDKLLGFSDFIKLVLDALDAAKIEYMIGGAVASWAWGEPRSTLGLDLVINVPVGSINDLSNELANRDILVPSDIILDALIEDRGDLPISAIHSLSGFKADLYLVRPDDPLRTSSFNRRKIVDLGPELGEVYLHSPEDLILYKLFYFSLSRQTKHLRDITAILQTLGDEIELDYIEYWVINKGLVSLWSELRKR